MAYVTFVEPGKRVSVHMFLNVVLAVELFLANEATILVGQIDPSAMSGHVMSVLVLQCRDTAYATIAWTGHVTHAVLLKQRNGRNTNLAYAAREARSRGLDVVGMIDMSSIVGWAREQQRALGT